MVILWPQWLFKVSFYIINWSNFIDLFRTNLLTLSLCSRCDCGYTVQNVCLEYLYKTVWSKCPLAQQLMTSKTLWTFVWHFFRTHNCSPIAKLFDSLHRRPMSHNLRAFLITGLFMIWPIYDSNKERVSFFSAADSCFIWTMNKTWLALMFYGIVRYRRVFLRIFCFTTGDSTLSE